LGHTPRCPAVHGPQPNVERGDSHLDDGVREHRVPFAGGAAPLRLFVVVDDQRGFEARAGHLELFSTLRIAKHDFAL
jgi:hypothetical protein